MPCVRALLTLLVAAVLGGVLAEGSSASAASGCPTLTFLTYDHLDYEATSVPAGVQVPSGSTLGGGTIDQPTSGNGCRRTQSSVSVQSVGSLAPQVVVRASGRPKLLFVIGHRCAGFTGSGYWDCLLRPLIFHGRQYTAISYPPPGRRLALGARIGTTRHREREVVIRRIQQVPASRAVGIAGQPATAYVSARTCPYSGFSVRPLYDNLLRCLSSPVWFTFDPPGNEVGATVVGRSDRPLTAAVAGASLSLVPLPVVADYVPADHARLIPVGRVSRQVTIRIPDVPAGLYEAVVSCPRCGSSPGAVDGLYPAGSILVTPRPRTSPGIQIVTYALAGLFLAAVILAFRTHRRRRVAMRGASPRGAARS